ncbi:LysR family transcriptional regulator [Actinomadura vinacea]|uniref:LysR family transcriptional regulator n=1 Tax=Actinomadura vinacea TaxID=115336 RepID=A0ABN3IEA1_9ACTN
MEFQQMASFLAVAEEHNFSRAADRLGVAQSSVSLQIKGLERDLGLELVSRSSRPVRLTPAGEAFRGEIRRVLELADVAVETARSVAEGRSGGLRVGFNFAAGQLVLLGALRRIRAEHPGLRVDLKSAQSGPQLRALADGGLDVALVFGAPSRPGWRSTQIQRVDLMALVGEEHPWSRRGRVSFRELAGQSCVLFGREQCPAMYDEIQAVAARTGTRLDVAEESNDPLATAVMVRARGLVGFTSAPRWDQSVRAGLVTVPLADPTPSLPVHAVWRTGTATGAVAVFLRCLRGPGTAGAATNDRETHAPS